MGMQFLKHLSVLSQIYAERYPDFISFFVSLTNYHDHNHLHADWRQWADPNNQLAWQVWSLTQYFSVALFVKKKSLIWNDSGSGRMRFFWVPSINSLVLDLWRAFRSNAKPFKYPQPCPVGQLRNLRHIKDTILFATLEAKVLGHCQK